MKKDWIYWIPRIFSIVFILFLALFSLDVFGNDYTFLETIIGLFMHNIPVFVLIIILIIAWKHEIVGAISFFVAALLYVILTCVTIFKNGFEWYYISWWATIAAPAIFIGVLFLIGWKRNKRNT